MSLDVLLQQPGTKPKPLCKVGRIVAGLEEPYQSALTNHLNTKFSDGGYTDEYLAQIMGQAGFPIGASTVRTHRKGACSCE